MNLNKKLIFYAVTAVFLIPLFVSAIYPEVAVAATVVEGISQPFFISSDYEFSGRNKINATLRMAGEKAQYFVEDDYWNNRSSLERQEILQQVNRLADEFDGRIYPVETGFWGQELNPGIDQDPKIII